MKGITLKTLLVLFMFFSFNGLKAQFSKKMEFDMHYGIQNTAAKNLQINNETSYDLGSTQNPLACIDLWYNINKQISVGINLEVSTYFPIKPWDWEVSEDEYMKFDENFPIEESYHTMSGLGVKYHFVNKKKFKAYGKASFNYSYNEVWQKNYHYTNVGEYPFRQIITYDNYIDNAVVYNSFGAQINVGMKTYFSNSFGMLFEGGYLNNGYYKGLTLSLGFFFDFIKD